MSPSCGDSSHIEREGRNSLSLTLEDTSMAEIASAEDTTESVWYTEGPQPEGHNADGSITPELSERIRANFTQWIASMSEEEKRQTFGAPLTVEMAQNARATLNWMTPLIIAEQHRETAPEA